MNPVNSGRNSQKCSQKKNVIAAENSQKCCQKNVIAAEISQKCSPKKRKKSRKFSKVLSKKILCNTAERFSKVPLKKNNSVIAAENSQK
jgi:hypothetical protein